MSTATDDMRDRHGLPPVQMLKHDPIDLRATVESAIAEQPTPELATDVVMKAFKDWLRDHGR